MIRIIKSEKNKDILIFNERMYEIKSKGGDKIYWRCYLRSCRASAHSSLNYGSNDSLVEVKRDHNHEIFLTDLYKKEYIYYMKVRMVETLDNPKSVINYVLRGKSSEIINAVGSVETVRKILRDYKNKILNPEPYVAENFQLSTSLTYTFRNEQFYQYGIGNYRGLEENENILIFYSRELFTRLKASSILCVDGTFKVVPKPYFQLFTVSFLESGHVYPVIYCLLKNKLESTYDSLFNILFRLEGNLTPRVIKTDFEIASLNSLRKKFPNSYISGCQFHLGQNLLRKIKELRLFNDYKINNDFKKTIKCLMGLAYVQPDKVIETFNSLASLPFFSRLALPVYSYFFDNYISASGRFEIQLWNHYNLFSINVPKTNNAIEGWHSGFNASFEGAKYSFILLVRKIKEDEESIQQKIRRYEGGEVFYRKRKYVLLEEELFRFFNNVERHFGNDYVQRLINLIYY